MTDLRRAFLSGGADELEFAVAQAISAATAAVTVAHGFGFGSAQHIGALVVLRRVAHAACTLSTFHKAVCVGTVTVPGGNA